MENRAFARSGSAFAKALGGKGKMVIYRLMKGKTKDSTVDEVWDKILERYHLSDATLYNLARIFTGAKYCCDRILPEMNHRHPQWVENLIKSMVLDDYSYFSPEFQQEDIPFLKDLKQGEPDVLWGIVTMIYIWCKRIDPYRGDTKHNFCRLIDALDELLYSLFPEKQDAHEISSNLKNIIDEPNLWRILQNCSILFRRYTDTDYAKDASQCMRLFHFGKRSFWISPDCCYTKGAEVWVFVEQSLGRASNGYYIVLRLEAGKDIKTFELKDALVFSFWTIDSEDDPCILQASRGSGSKREWCFYVYEYDEGKRGFSLDANPETGNLFELPSTLQMINWEHPNGKDEKVWARILKIWDENRGSTVFQKAKEMLSERIELNDEYKLVDVLISRNKFTLVVNHQEKIIKYELPIEAYDFLSEITPSRRILIVRHIDDNEVYIEWPDMGYSIRLSEFTIVE